MKKLIFFMLLIASCFLVAGPAKALPLLQEDFSGTSISNGLTLTSTTNLNQWIDFPNSFRWVISGGGQGGPLDNFAQHYSQTSDNTNLLIYGVDVSSLGYLESFSLEFDYIAGVGRAGVIVAGLPDVAVGTDKVDPYAPWFYDNALGYDGTDTTDVRTIFSQNLALTGVWDSASFTNIIIPDQFDALAVGFIFGGTSGFRGVDNIEFSAKPVPEPATMLLLGAGLVGLAGFGRKKFFKK